MAAARPSSIVGWPVVAPHATGRSICNITTGHDEAAANACLIAAAPDLLAALELILSPSPHYGATQAHRDRIAEARTKGLAAITKARGEVAP